MKTFKFVGMLTLISSLSACMGHQTPKSSGETEAAPEPVMQTRSRSWGGTVGASSDRNPRENDTANF